MVRSLKIIVFTLSLLVAVSMLHASDKGKGVPVLTGDIPVLTGDIREDYEIIGNVSAKHIRGVAEINAELSRAASAMGADYVINVDYFGYQSKLHAVGTAVKLKEDEEEPVKSE